MCAFACMSVCTLFRAFLFKILSELANRFVLKKIRNKRIRITFYDVYQFRRVQSIRMEIMHIYQVPDKIISIRPC